MSELQIAAPAEVAPAVVPTIDTPVETRLRPRVGLTRAVADGGEALLIWFSLFVVYGGQRPLSQAGLVAVTVAAGIWLVAVRCPALPGCNVLPRLVAIGVGTSAGLVMVTVVNSTVPGHYVSFRMLVTGGLAVFCSIAAWEWLVDRILAGRRRVLLVGTEDAKELLTEELRTSPRARYDVVAAIPGAEELAEIVEAQRPDIVVLTDEATYGPALDRLLDARADVRVAGFEGFFELAFGRVPIDQITPAWFMSLLHPQQRVYTRRAKRTFDVAVALVLLVLAAPVIALVALATKLGGGPVLYRQTRLGEGGQRFTIYKFRTMRCDAECDGAAFSCENDPRVTPVGRVLRRDAPRRAPAALERPRRGHERRRPPAGAARVHRADRGEGAVLEPPAARQAGGHGLGPGPLRLCERGRGHGDEALVRPLVPAEREHARRPRRVRDDGAGGLRSIDRAHD